MKISPKFARVDALCDALDQEVMFHLSLHSKELFHSNFFGWFCERFPAAARSVLENFIPARDTSNHRVQRERHNLDLVVELPGLTPVVIENKVFSPPDNEQLDRYSTELESELFEPAHVLLSLGSPNWAEDTYQSTSGCLWKHVSYRDLASALRGAAELLSGFDYELVLHYVNLVDLLQNLVDEIGFPSQDETIASPADIQQLLQEVRLHDAIGKLRARNAIAILSQSTSKRFSKCEPQFDANFTNGQPLVEAFFQLPNGDRVGWQYQAGQWRLAVITKTHFGKSADERTQRHLFVAREYASWFDFFELPKLIDREIPEIPKTEIKGDFNGYNPDFVYRYRSFPDLTMGEAKVLSDFCLRRAAEAFWSDLSPRNSSFVDSLHRLSLN